MNFQKAVRETPHLQNAWKNGLSALRAKDKPHIAPQDPRLLKGSANVDSALQAQHPHAHRWDFAIGFRHSNWQQDFVYWVEVHTAESGEVNVVLDKLSWLRDWLAADGKLLNQFKRDFIWVSSGATSFTPGDPRLKRIAERGLQHKGRILRIPSARPV